MNYLLHILIMICIYLILSLSLNLLVGYTGLLSLCHAAFYGIGAYITTLLVVKIGFNFSGALFIAVLGTMLVSLLMVFPSLRLKGDYFILAGFGFQVIIFSILYNWIPVTRGPYGISGIPRPAFFGVELYNIFLLSSVLAGICIFILWRLGSSPFGRALKTIREDEIVAQSLGKNTTNLKLTAFIIAVGIAAIAGGLYAGYVQYIDPTSFTIMESVFIITIILVGGTGNIRGPIVGTFLLIILPEALRFLGLPDTMAPNVREMIYGFLLIILMRYRRQGIAGEYKFE